ncbi:tyrosine-type recombinase/integrase [Escherichia coli]|nr:tyrosine-type recombinase/integrase [Escherichia coli]ELH7703548.1 tyrosine-type recombinase/integrase [Escherichia coli]
MFVVTQLNVVPHLRLWVLVDSETSLPLLFPLRFLIDRLSLRSASTQATALQSLKFFYDFWFKKYGVTFCFSFHQSGHNPLIAIEELESFYHYLESGNSNVPKLRIVNHHKPATHSCTNVRHVHAVIRFITYMINTYISPRYMDESPKELSRLSSRLTNRVSMLRDEFQTGKIKNSHKQFRSLTAEMVRIFYEVIRPSSSSQINQLNPFPIGEIQFRNYLICRLLLNYGLRVSEVLLLEINSIKTNIRGDQFSIIVSSVEDDVKDPRKRLPALKNTWASRVLALERHDYQHLIVYINKIRHSVKHDFLFTSTKNKLSPLSYHSVYSLFARIDKTLNDKYSKYKRADYFDSVDNITPHITRHTWAYLTLQRIYCEKYHKIKHDSRLSGVDFSIAGLMNEAKDELRILGGWSHDSNMPDLYARRFLSERANLANINRIIMDMSEDNIFEITDKIFTEINT